MPTYALGPLSGDHQILAGHPASHGGLRLHLEASNGVIESARIEHGFMNRGVEQLFPARDYRQGLMMANRHDWSAPSSGEFAYALAIESLLGLKTPPRADLIRVIIAELDRASSHALFLAALPGFTSPLLALREKLQGILEAATGARMHHHMIVVGGIHHDVDLAWLARGITPLLDEFQAVDVASFAEEWKNLGKVSIETLLSHGASGTILRAAGSELDERTLRPYSGYAVLPIKVSSEQSGDVSARIRILHDEILTSLQYVLGAIDVASELADQEILQRTPKNLRLPPGESFVNVEGALGITGVALFSEGDRSPARVRLRTPSVGNLSALEALLPGVALDHLEMMLASWPFLPGDLDR
ncbi:MAG: NADH-quinone oxidoreductase subunit D [Actinobacteria bacterium]|nr:NADH-quinone oxidoreductase subunit D [Actinomycetota bacterium]